MLSGMLSSRMQRAVGCGSQVCYNYISKKALDDIEKAHGRSAFQRTLMYAKQARHIAKEGFLGFKSDLEQYFKIVMAERAYGQPLTPEQQRLKRKILQNIGKLKPIMLINILPFSAPLLVFYILTYPTKVPSYFCLDELYDLHQHQAVEKQKEAVEAYRANPISRSELSLAKMSLEELKLLSQLLFGHFEDGVVGINKYFKQNPKSYMLHPHFSKHLVIRKIKAELKNDEHTHPQLADMTTEEQVLWKYDRVMSGEDRVVYKPITEPIDSLKYVEAGGSEAASEAAAKEPVHTRHSATHHAPHKSVEHERTTHKSETRKNK